MKFLDSAAEHNGLSVDLADADIHIKDISDHFGRDCVATAHIFDDTVLQEEELIAKEMA